MPAEASSPRMEEPATAEGGEARSCAFAVWLHGLGDCGRANEVIADHFSAAAFANTRWAFPTAPTSPVTCNRGMLMPSWFDIHDTPITSKSVKGEEDVLRAVQSVHAIIDREIAVGTDPEEICVFGLSQGGALSIASVLLYPKTLGGCAVFSGFLPFSSSFASRITAEAKKTPVLWTHGGAESLVPIEEAGRDGVKFLRGLGVSCEFKVYDTLGHTLAPFELDYCQRWASENITQDKEQRPGPAFLKKGHSSSRQFRRHTAHSNGVGDPIIGSLVDAPIKQKAAKRAVRARRCLYQIPNDSYPPLIRQQTELLCVRMEASPTTGGFVLWLHGSRGTGDESRAQVAPYFAAPELASAVRLSFPTAPATSVACYGGEVINAWFGISEIPITAKTVRDEREVLKAVDHVHKLLDKEVAVGTDPSNIFVCGMSQGGTLVIVSTSCHQIF